VSWRTTTHLAYVRAICYDESVYPEPHTYNPARFLDEYGRINPSVKAPEARIFGSGRRYEFPRHASQLLKYLPRY
jgi:cytochrome P450